MTKALLGGALALLATSSAYAQIAPVVQATGTSPDKPIQVAITLDDDGRPTYAVTRRGTAVVAPSRLGVMFTDAPKIEHKVGIDSHEPIKDTGLRRTYPNWLAREGGRGMEYNAWPGKNPPEHEANMFFTQWLGGPMDFAPRVLSLEGSEGSPLQSTEAKQLALNVVIYSIVIERRQVRRGDTRTVALAPGRGQAIRFVAAGGKARRL
ncbi:hypothetical protein FHT02_001464 [Sphingomonas xinjiangensis]|uniref:Glycosyl-hydrolase 97 catalytic domain-containing protein n=1 Tax=Sphingomonas xinjiangensis TaxID=643568 RepID=A0A840YLD3_9SPHN|nr:hypothetical protein [Sphingomonas xinjiangensis]